MIRRQVRKIKAKHVREVMIYGLVGITALLFQDLVYWLLHRYFNIFPSISMLVGNGVGMIVAYYGHIKFTFSNHYFSKREFSKFMLSSLIGLCINVGGVRVLTKVFMLSPAYGIIPTLITPFVTFLLSKFWAFR